MSNVIWCRESSGKSSNSVFAKVRKKQSNIEIRRHMLLLMTRVDDAMCLKHLPFLLLVNQETIDSIVNAGEK